MEPQSVITPGNAPQFAPGSLYITPTAQSALTNHDIITALQRHVRGDWGNLDPADKAANDRALAEGTRLLSAFESAARTKFWVITEADRASTTILLPEDY